MKQQVTPAADRLQKINTPRQNAVNLKLKEAKNG